MSKTKVTRGGEFIPLQEVTYSMSVAVLRWTLLIAAVYVFGFFVYWEKTVLTLCDFQSTNRMNIASAKLGEFCHAGGSRAQNQLRLQDPDCIHAAEVVQSGVGHAYSECWWNEHFHHMGQCSSVPACAWVIDWVDTLRVCIYPAILLGIMYLLHVFYRLWMANSNSTRHAIDLLRMHARSERDGLLGGLESPTKAEPPPYTQPVDKDMRFRGTRAV